VAFEVNFGAQETPWFKPEDGFIFPDDCKDITTRVNSPAPPSSKSDCEVSTKCEESYE